MFSSLMPSTTQCLNIICAKCLIYSRHSCWNFKKKKAKNQHQRLTLDVQIQPVSSFSSAFNAG